MVLRNSRGQFRSRGKHDNTFFTSNTLSDGIAQFEPKMINSFDNIISGFAGELAQYARTNAPWDDRTGNARAGIQAEYMGDEEGTLNLVLYHTVDYGPWLEIRWGGKYAIILPTLEVMGTKMLDACERMMDRIVFYE